MKFEIPQKALSTLREAEPITAVCRVIPLINQYGNVKGFILKSVIGEVGKKKEEKQERPKEKTIIKYIKGVER